MSFSDFFKKIKESIWNVKEINDLNIEIVYLRHFMSYLWRLWSKTHLKQNSIINDIFIVDKYNYLVCKISFISTILISIYNKYSLSYFYLNNTSIAVTGVEWEQSVSEIKLRNCIICINLRINVNFLPIFLFMCLFNL